MPLLCAYANDGEATASETVVRAMREVTIGKAAGAVAQNVDAFHAETGIDQLTAVSLYQVEMQTRANVTVPWCSGRKKQHWVLFLDGVRVENFIE